MSDSLIQRVQLGLLESRVFTTLKAVNQFPCLKPWFTVDSAIKQQEWTVS